MTPNFDRYQDRDALIDWIANAAQWNTLITLTLAQARPNGLGVLRGITPEDCAKTAWIFRDRFAKKVAGNAARKVAFAAFVEGNGAIKRYHLHALAAIPSGFHAANVRIAVDQLVHTLDWLRPDYDVKPITHSVRDVVNYSLKEGNDAFLQDAFHTPQSTGLLTC